ncbi:class I SAM-dependent methyltransferase [Amycolatopsis sp. NPDC048633]|uniref:class I SAM-dependent methyltransferase n=1 Tax=Amycolatopsis sp. NPDC048633 TaxID=3157095 RepID=UPI0033FB0CE5
MADGFADAWALAEPVKGWMTRAQGEALWQAARRLEKGDVVLEIGSHQGRSTIVLGAAARTVGATVIAVDPFVDGRLFGGSPTRQLFERNIRQAGLDDVVELVAGYSTELRPDWDRPIQLLYIDGKHDYWTYTDDLRWSAHLPPDAEILVHDCFSSIGVTLGTIAKVLFGRRYAYVDRATSLARFRLTPPSTADRVRVLAQLPWFLRNVGIKVLLRLRLRPVARLFGHDSPYDPY